MIRDLLRYDHPLLHMPIEKNLDLASYDFECDMLDSMNAYGGYGLAANQIGYKIRAMAIATDEGGVVMYNPRIVDKSETSQELEEGCLTYPGLLLKITRPRVIKVRYSDRNMVTMTKTFQDFTARIFQHEVDHLDGITIIDRLDGLKREFAKKKWAKLVRRNGGNPAKRSAFAVDTRRQPPDMADSTV